MFPLEPLRRARDDAREVVNLVGSSGPQHPIAEETNTHFELGCRLLEELERGGQDLMHPSNESETRAWMACQQHFQRCLALEELIRNGAGDDAPAPPATYRFMGFHRNYVLVRRMISCCSWLRSRVLNYRPHYRSPPLIQSAFLSLSEIPWLIRTREKVKMISRRGD